MNTFRYITKGEFPKPSSSPCDCIIVWNEEPKIPYHVVKISVVRTENRFEHQRTDAVSRRKERVKAIKAALSSLWKAIRK